MKYLYKEIGIRDLSFNASLNPRGALRKPHSALRGVVPGASGPTAAVFILQTHPNRMVGMIQQNLLYCPVQPSVVQAQDYLRGDIQSMETQSKNPETRFCLIGQTSIFLCILEVLLV